MKKRVISIPVFLFLAAICASCGSSTDPFGDEMGDLYVYSLNFRFVDDKGNNLVKDIPLEEWMPSSKPATEAISGSPLKDCYNLDIILSEQSDKWNNETYNVYARPGFTPDVNKPEFIWYKDDDGGSLYCELGLYSGYCVQQEMLTYKIACPIIFGDNETHIINTFWGRANTKTNGTYKPECYRVEFKSQTIELDLQKKIVEILVNK